MKTATKSARQGDVMFLRVMALPRDVAPESQSGRIVVAHSETGHHHVIESPCAEYFTVPSDPFAAYLRLAEDVEVKHLRAWDTHDSITLPAGIWKVRRQREYTPEGFRVVED